MTPVRVFIGYDPRQPVAFQVAAHSVWKYASAPVSITRLQLNQLPLTRQGLTEFTYSRFLVPYLSNYEGVSIFLDSDTICQADICVLLGYPLAYPDIPVFVSKNPQRFEWPSVMVFQNNLCRILTPEYIEKQPCFDFVWATSIGDLPREWNHLVGYDTPNPEAKLIHYTQGVPCWPETRHCEHSQAWKALLAETMATVPFETLMGRSVHVKHMKKQAVDG